MREEENKRSSQKSSVKRFFKKRWVFPAIYIASAAIILTGVLWYQSSSSNTDKYDYKATDLSGKKTQPPAAVEVNKAMENFKMPVANAKAAEIKTQFYDFNGKTEDQESALVFYNNTYQPNTGLDIAMKDGESFDVTASLSGTVTRVEEDPLLGNVIEIEHDKGVVTQYQSVTDIKVATGQEVKQGDVLARAGESMFNEKAGTHVHFEIRKDGVAVNPTKYFEKSLSTLMDERQESVETPSQKQQEKLEDLEKSTEKKDESQSKEKKNS